MSELSQDEKIKLAERCYRSPVEFCRVFLPGWFTHKMPWVHRGILALRLGRCDFLLDFGDEVWAEEVASWTPEDLKKLLLNFVEEGTNRPIFQLSQRRDGTLSLAFSEWVQPNIGVIMPRGFSKTTVMNAANLIEIVYHSMDFFLYVSEASGHAERQLSTIKEQLGNEDGVPNNDVICEIFGTFQPPRQSALKWTENYIETTKKVRVGCTGRNGQIRGFSKGAKRPGVIIYDDLEDEESVKSDDQRKKSSKWFWGTAMPTVRKNGRSFVIGTLLHPTDAILNKVIISPEFTCVRFGAIDRQGDALWPFMMTLEQIEAKKQAMAAVGEIQAFYLEYMSEWKEDKTQMFPSSLLVYVPRGYENFVAIAEAMDPAISDNPKADFCTFGIVGMENGGRKHVLDYYGEKGMDPNDQIDKYFELHFQHCCRLPAEFRRHGVEAVAYQRALIGLITNMQFQKSMLFGMNAYFEVMPILHGKTGKMARVQGILKPLMSSKYVTFEQKWPDLHTMFVDWPNSKLDGPDVIAMAISLLDPFASLNLNASDQNPQQLHNPLPSLAQAIGGNFRHAP